MEMVVLITRQMENEEALTFLTSMEPKLGGNKEARALCFLTKAEVQLARKDDVAGAKVCKLTIKEINLTDIMLTITGNAGQRGNHIGCYGRCEFSSWSILPASE